VSLPETPLPPIPRLVNFADIQAIDATKRTVVTWDFSEPPLPTDFVQLYVTIGHGVVVTSPDFGEPGALDGTVRSQVMPPFALDPGFTYSLNIEIMRLASTNATCYPSVEGVGATFSSTSVDFTTLPLPVMRLNSGPQSGLLSVEVLFEPDKKVILQTSDDLVKWSNVATNAASSGTNVFTIPVGGQSIAFLRATTQWSRRGSALAN
jgi:hypothetical protein